MRTKKESARLYYQRHREEVLQKVKKYNQKHKEQKKIFDKQYAVRNKLHRTKYYKEYYKKNREAKIEKAKQWRQAHKLHRKIYEKEYRQEHKNQRNEHEKDKRGQDIGYRILINLRTRLNRALKRNSKSKSTIQLIGCPIKQLKQYLQKQFKEGMSWANYGINSWHIDHITPCCSFDLSKPKEQRKCFHYTNLQPLWAGENLRKRSKVIN